MSLIKNFDLLDSLGYDGSEPEKGEWLKLINGEDPRIPADYALFLWWSFCALSSVFWDLITLKDPVIESDINSVSASIERYLELANAQCENGLELTGGHKVDSAFWGVDWYDGVEEVRLIAVYGMWCVDQLISALRAGDILSAAKAASFFGQCVGEAEDINAKFKTSPHLATSQDQRRRAFLRHQKDPKQQEKLFVFECWEEWQKAPRNYSGKAAFARDMLQKCEHLISQKQIEDWCRTWEKERQSAAD